LSSTLADGASEASASMTIGERLEAVT